MSVILSPLLDGARAKVKRARQHLQQLNRDIIAFCQAHPYIARIEEDANGGWIHIVAETPSPFEPPLNIVLLAGEAAHQLRSALDHAVYALCFKRYRRPPKHKTQFPIFETRAGYETRGCAMIKDIPRFASAYIKRMQPYKATGSVHKHPLWILQDLNNTDKHRMIPVAIFGAWALHLGETSWVKRSSILYGPSVEPLKHGAKLFSMPVDPNLKMEMKPEMECAVAFQKIGGSELKPVIPLMKELCSTVDRIIYDLSFLAFK